MDAATSKGFGGGIEQRAVLGEKTWIKGYGYFAEEERSFFEDEYTDEEDRDRTRWMWDIEGEHYVSDSLYGKTQVTQVSDRQFFKDYGEESRRSRSEFETVSLRSQEKIESVLFVNKNWDRSNLVGEINHYNNLIESDRTTLQRVPKVSFSSARQPLPFSPLFFDADTSYGYFRRREGVQGHRFDLHPSLSLPINYRNFFKFLPEIGFREVVAFDLDRSSGQDDNEALFDVYGELSTTLLKIFNVQGRRVEKLKHSIEPRLTYLYVPDVDQEDFPTFDFLERFYERNMLTYSITNRLTGKMRGDDGTLSEYEIAFLRLAQSYHLSTPVGGLLPEFDPGHKFSSVSAEVRVRASPYSFFKGTLSYNPHDANLDQYGAVYFWRPPSNRSLHLEYRYIRHALEGSRFKGRYQLNSAFAVFFENRNSARNSTTLKTTYGLDYNAQCWAIRFYLTERAKQEGRKHTQEFGLIFSLAGLGEIGSFDESLD
jgi:LPS-assembly protein